MSAGDLFPVFREPRPVLRPVDDGADGPDPLDRLVRCVCPLPCDRCPADELGRAW